MKSHSKSKSDKVKEFLEYAEKLILEDKLSPDVVIGRALAMGIFTKEEVVCVNTLYRYIDEGRLKVKNIDLKEKVGRKKCKTKPKQNKKILGISIDERPAHIDNREEFGHFKIDIVHRKKGESTCLLTLTERKTRKGIVLLIDFKDSESVRYTLNKIIKEYSKGIIKSITVDNGVVFLVDLFLKNENGNLRAFLRFLLENFLSNLILTFTFLFFYSFRNNLLYPMSLFYRQSTVNLVE